MSPDATPDRERLRRLMMAALDGEISREQRQELDRALETDRAARQEWEQMSRVKQVTSAMRFREPPEEVWQEYWTSIYARMERGVGWVLLSVGAIVLLGYATWELVQAIVADSDVPWGVKLALAALGIGGVVLLVSVAREKLFTWRRDPYREIER